MTQSNVSDFFPAAEYATWLESLKARVRETQSRAAVAANKELVLLYWTIGTEILERQQQQGWGAKVVERLSQDLLNAFPGMSGLSARNLKYMRAFAAAWPDLAFVQQVAAQMPWGHNMALLDKLESQEQRSWYARAAIENGWSRGVLVHQIDLRLIDRQGAAVTNFTATLPPGQSELAQQLTKDPYLFETIGLGETFRERELEEALVSQMQRFLLELGRGFAFVGRQYHLEVDDRDFYIDLLFYNVRLHAYVAIDLKVVDFAPEFVGKMQFYLAALDSQVKSDIDGPSIGLILCKTKSGVIAEYALRDTKKPMGVAEYRVALPPALAGELPSVADIVTVIEGNKNSPS
jgi:predicted nuclease of restriction endonuclease-like (RecB) superfamily